MFRIDFSLFFLRQGEHLRFRVLWYVIYLVNFRVFRLKSNRSFIFKSYGNIADAISILNVSRLLNLKCFQLSLIVLLKLIYGEMKLNL